MDLRPNAVIEVHPLPGETLRAACDRMIGSVPKRAPYLPIDRGIPVPPADARNPHGVAKPRIRWGLMSVGDSTFAPGETAASARMLMDHAHKRLGHRYRARVENGGVRIWRVE